ncbi:MAG: hypothetical protein O3C27_09420 [Actinomycetota bacterium]|nr:hypothetical protein [Actinomycetota bacterium]
MATSAERPRLHLIDRAALRRLAARRVAYFTTCFLLVAGVFAVALAQAELVQRQHRLDQTRRSIVEADAELARLEREVDRASSPAVIISRANALGMVRAAEPVYFTAVRPLVEAPANGGGD